MRRAGDSQPPARSWDRGGYRDTSRGRPAAGRGVRSGRFRSVGEWRGVRPHVRAHALLVHAAYRPAGPVKSSRPLIRVLVINDNGLWINDFI